jgi:hypothetical protein
MKIKQRLGAIWKAAVGVGATGAPNTGAMEMALGRLFGDTFNKSRAPSALELVQELVGTAYACTMLNADLMASTPLRLYVRTRKNEPRSKISERGETTALGKKSLEKLKGNKAAEPYINGDVEVEEVLAHPVLDLLQNVGGDARNLSKYDLQHTTQVYQESVGRAYWWVERNGIRGTPSTRWLLASHWVREVVDPLTGLIDHYEYGPKIGLLRIPVDQIVKFNFTDPFNPYLGGLSPLRASIDKIRIGRKGDAQTNALLDNMGRPDAVFTPKGTEDGWGIGEDEAVRLRAAFRRSFARAGRGGVLVSEVPGTLEPMTWPMADIIEVERAIQTKEDICNTFGVPISKMARNDANLASAETGDRAHAKDAGVPRTIRNAEVLNTQLLPMYPTNGRMFFAYDNPVPEDKANAREEKKTNVVVSAGMLKLQQAYYGGLIPREAAVAQATAVFSYSEDQAAEFFPKTKLLQKPDDKKPGEQS